ncbi:M14 family metallocarboxypeptidase [Alishewanella sp. SMS8]|uniref:M14 family metallopeptidase n=1 Tax=Alishewanella sp. SMS8 TaxID=2994676 RepID=UPI002742053F|nr:M14 family metallocarboxypeptidase [Alishewanella sp. SMS8]MDP5460007.1 M14 family metallocarboxypeptidase [Alishewanella sp. SMS8]
MTETVYAIGTPGQPWTGAEKQQWLNLQKVQRSYQQDVLALLATLDAHFEREQYGAVDYQAQGFACYPLYILKSRDWRNDKPLALITGGVHGYETSGVHGALRFAAQHAAAYLADFNLLIAPCISPWAYETINRWSPLAVDPNRSFSGDSASDEARYLREYIQRLCITPLLHIDLHETTDSDNTEFRPAKAARDGTVNTNWNIPDGFYLVGDAERPEPAFQQAIINEVAKVTHIAPPDENGELIGDPMVQPGVINYPKKALGLCGRVTEAPYVTTTEVYPDSPSATPEQCVMAQVTAICAALNFVRQAS